MAIKRGSRVESSFSAASMTDLIFLLLIFFMVATTLINPNALKVMLPKGNYIAREKPQVTVTVKRDLTYYVGSEQVSFDQIGAALRAQVKDTENPTVSIHGDEGVPYGEVMKVAQIVKDNNYNLHLATRSQ